MAANTEGDARSRFDVVIVGGRPAGAALAARLGAHGLRVLVLDRATFPSLPDVPSSPILYPAAMQLLDEIGVDEASYADEHAKTTLFTFDFSPHWTARIPLPALEGRRYVYGVDRATFDAALWDNLARFESVERREGFSVRDLLRDGHGRAVGVAGVDASGAERRFEAGCVVGADGRFSSVARRAGAEVVEERSEHVSTIYYADWEGVAPTSAGDGGAHVCTTGRGLDVIMFAMPRGRYSVNTHARADRVFVDGDPERYYLDTLRSIPLVARRLEGARRVSRVVGMKRVGNGYRRASGPGWVLVGDALHYKDPVDGQGIYDALLEAKLLARALVAWHGGADLRSVTTVYERDVRAATYPMFQATTARLKRELYEEPPVPVIRTLLRWMMTDEAYQTTFVRYLNREVDPSAIMAPKLLAGAAARGFWRDMTELLRAPSIQRSGTSSS